MLLRDNVTGLQHLGIPVVNLKESVEWYENIGFEKIHEKTVVNSDGVIDVIVSFMELENFTIELYQLNSEETKEIKSRSHGHIDHIALNVKDIEKAYNELKEANFTFLEDKITEFPLFKNGVKYFLVIGPNGEKVEFNQCL